MPLELAPTFHGYILSNEDALYVVEAALANKFPLVYRRPLDSERPHLIRLGNVFVFIEESSDIKRWTDGIAWSASRILGRFLIYRKLDRSATLNKSDKRKAKGANGKRKNSRDSVFSSEDDSEDRRTDNLSVSVISDMYSHYDNIDNQNSRGRESTNTIAADHWRPLSPETPVSISQDRGLIKKTLSLAILASESDTGKPKTVHLISYFCAHDVLAGNLVRPSQTELRNTEISSTLWLAIRKSSLGGKLLAENEANFYLDSKYQLQNMSSIGHDDKLQSHFDHETRGKIFNGPPRRYSSVYSADSFKDSQSIAPGGAPMGTLFRPPFSAPVESSHNTLTGVPQHFFPENETKCTNQVDGKSSRKKQRTSNPNLANPYCSSTETLHSEIPSGEPHFSKTERQPEAMHRYVPLALQHPNFGEGYRELKPEVPAPPKMFSGGHNWNPGYYGAEMVRGMASAPGYHGMPDEQAGRHEYESYSSPSMSDALNNRAFGVQVTHQTHQKPSVINNPQPYAYLPQHRWDFYSNNGPTAVSSAAHDPVHDQLIEYDSHGIYE